MRHCIMEIFTQIRHCSYQTLFSLSEGIKGPKCRPDLWEMDYINAQQAAPLFISYIAKLITHFGYFHD